jgi:hypothetical protein
MTLLLGLIATLLASGNVWASELSFVEKDGTIARNEAVLSTVISNEGPIQISIHGKTTSCVVRTKTIEEAYAIQDRLVDDKTSWLQCFGKAAKRVTEPDSIVVETERYALGRLPKVATPLAQAADAAAPSVATPAAKSAGSPSQGKLDRSSLPRFALKKDMNWGL